MVTSRKHGIFETWAKWELNRANGEERNTAATKLHCLSWQESEGRTSEASIG